MLRIRVTSIELRMVEAEAEASGRTVSERIRGTLLARIGRRILVTGFGVVEPFGVLKHGIHESRRVNRGRAIVEPDDDSAIQPFGRNYARGGTVLHFRRIAAFFNAVCLANNPQRKFKSGPCQDRPA
jgi:hypothetical protein